jgi:peptide/nickel transport system substrate-binding protein
MPCCSTWPPTSSPWTANFTRATDDTGQPKDAIVKIGPSFALKNESGTGPFKVTFPRTGRQMVMERFADYWDKKSPGNVDQNRSDPHQGGCHPRAALLSGDVDFISPVPPQDFERIEGFPSQSVYLFRAVGSSRFS